jgi:MSHA biogenesis protein MshQ
VTGIASGNVGRFIPDHFDVAYNVPQFTPACGTFTYLGQPITYATAPVITVTARNLAGGTTQNYKGTTPAAQAFWKITNASLTGKTYASNFGTPTITTPPSPDPAIVVSGNGTGTLTFGAGTGLMLPRTAEVVPTDAEIQLSINVIDTDSVAYATNPASFGGTASGTGIGFATSKQMRFGRLRLGNAFGSELLDLPIPVETQYYNASGVYVTNTADNCTSLAVANVFLSSQTAAISGSGLFAAGKGNLRILKPSAKVSVDLCVDLDGSASDGTCVATTSAAKPWLQWKWSGSAFDRDPRARATFGVFRNADEFIYLRENF